MTSSWRRPARCLLVAVTAGPWLALTACGSPSPAGEETAGPTVIDPAVETSGSGADGVGGPESDPDPDSGSAVAAATTAPATAAPMPEATVPTMDTLVPALDGAHVAIVVDEGGQCGGAVCRSVLELLADGRWGLIDQTGQVQADGMYDAEALAGEARAVAADPGLLASGPFLGRCPTEGGGRERFYRVFDQADPTLVVADLSSCADQLNADAPFLVALDLLLAEAERLAAEAN